MAERRRVFGFLIVVLLVLAALLAGVTWLPVRHARAQWRAGQIDQSIKTADEWSRLPLWTRQYHQLRAAAHLTAGRREQAAPHLHALWGGETWLPAVTKEEVAKQLFARGLYGDFLKYDAASRERSESADVPLYRALAHLAHHDVRGAETVLRGATGDATRLAAIRKAIDERRDGSWPFVFDRKGKPIASFDTARREVVDSIVSLPLAPFANERIETTLDADVQQIAMNALGERKASLVAIDPRTNEVLAIASTGKTNLAMERQYEPGSVIKVLTILAALSSGVDVAKHFPYDCKGALAIDGRSFGDWREGGHGRIGDLDEALAQSCNVVFADLGLNAGREKLLRLHRAAGFDGHADLGLFRVPLGRTVGQIFNKFETAFYAIGLEHETTTTFHLAMIASMLANRGELTTPRIFSTRRSVLGEVIAAPPKLTKTRIASRADAERTIAAMQAVVEHPRGSARRAAIDGLAFAAKTGTAGDGASGYDALMIGFAPAEQPKIAFALIAENAGPAEFAAAQVAKSFLEGLRAKGHL